MFVVHGDLMIGLLKQESYGKNVLFFVHMSFSIS